MSGIPQHTRLLVTRLLDAYCARICPPSARHAVPIGYRLAHDAVVIEEHRRILGVAGTRRAVPVARLRWQAARGCWTLEHADRSGAMRRYRPLPSSRSFIELLREFDADPAGLFWGRIDGKSLRWCRPEGRCAPCEAKYCGVLGMPRQLQAGQAPTMPGADASGGGVSS
ncbi:MAG: DUF3024 domain-containing protein [Gammaproteobacteria bacterium]|nr:DUF3024 domain-containing protein [Gammaproteobacteria bacterium]